LFVRNVHSLVVNFGLESDRFIARLLIDMYSKYRKTQDGRRFFELVLEKNIVK